MRVRWCRRLLDNIMPHAFCATRAGLHGTSRLQEPAVLLPLDCRLAGPVASRSTAEFLTANLEPNDSPFSLAVDVWRKRSARRDR